MSLGWRPFGTLVKACPALLFAIDRTGLPGSGHCLLDRRVDIAAIEVQPDPVGKDGSRRWCNSMSRPVFGHAAGDTEQASHLVMGELQPLLQRAIGIGSDGKLFVHA